MRAWHDNMAANHPVFGGPLIKAKLRVLSLGAGVQSSTVALMAAHGEITPAPDVAIFADTQSEPAAVYRHLDWLVTVLPFPVIRVTAGNIEQELFDAAANVGESWCRPPLFLQNPDGTRGQLNRQCTRDYKIDPIHREIRRLVGLEKGEQAHRLVREVLKPEAGAPTPRVPVVEQWVGISWDEMQRSAGSGVWWIHRREPLLELEMPRWACERWLQRNGYPIPPKSACRICPYASDRRRGDLQRTAPDDHQAAVAVDEAIRHGMRGVKAEALYLHPSLRPLSEIDFNGDTGQADAFDGECTGMCGV